MSSRLAQAALCLSCTSKASDCFCVPNTNFRHRLDVGRYVSSRFVPVSTGLGHHDPFPEQGLRHAGGLAQRPNTIPGRGGGNSVCLGYVVHWKRLSKFSKLRSAGRTRGVAALRPAPVEAGPIRIGCLLTGLRVQPPKNLPELAPATSAAQRT